MPNPKNADQIARMASSQLGTAPPNQPTTENPAAAQGQPQVPNSGVPKPKTAAENAQEKVTPKTEGDKAGEKPAIAYEIEFGGSKRKLSPEQIVSTFQRYADANSELTEMAPVLQLAKELLKGGKGTPAQLADFLKTSLVARANQPNPTMGNVKGEQGGVAQGKEGSPNAKDAMKQWMEENEITSLPPGYEDMIGMRGELARMSQMMQALLSTQRATTQGAQATVEQAKAERANMTKMRIAQNLNQIQGDLGLPDDSAEDFFAFAAERGYVTEDFVNPQLVRSLAMDFKNNMNSPELERLKGIHARRQAFTGVVSPSSDGMQSGAGGEPSRLDRMAKMANR